MHDSSLQSSAAVHINPAWNVAIIRSIWHGECTQSLSDDAVQHLLSLGMSDRNILTLDAPGSFEIPLLCAETIKHQHVEGIIAFGVIVQGETHHAEIIASESARAIMDLQMQTGVPIIYEILFVEHIDHAKARSIGSGGKGKLAADTLLRSLAQVDKLRL